MFGKIFQNKNQKTKKVSLSGNPAVAAQQLKKDKKPKKKTKGTKEKKWLVPTFIALLVVGLLWVVVYYVTSQFPIPQIGSLNIVLGFVFIVAGFLLMPFWK
jgi:uncharacterized membrane protein